MARTYFSVVYDTNFAHNGERLVTLRDCMDRSEAVELAEHLNWPHTDFGPARVVSDHAAVKLGSRYEPWRLY